MIFFSRKPPASALPIILRVAFLLLMMTVSFEGGAKAETGPFAGPIGIRNQFPLQQTQLTFKPQQANVLSEGQLATDFVGSWTNTFVLADAYTVDAESLDGRVAARLGTGDTTELSFELPLQWRGGGKLDRVISKWHHGFGLPRGDRDQVQDDEFNIVGVRKDLRGFSIDDDGWNLGNLSLGAKHLFFNSSKLMLSGALELSLPTFGGMYGHQGVDLLTGVVASVPWSEKVAVHAGGAMLWYSADNYDGVPLSSLHAESFVNFEAILTQDWSLLAGLYGGSKTVEQVTGYPDYFLYFDLGGRYKMTETRAVTFNLRENPAPHDGTADVSFSLGVESTWR